MTYEHTQTSNNLDNSKKWRGTLVRLLDLPGQESFEPTPVHSAITIDSSYGLQCWEDDDGNSYGQIQFGAPFGFAVVDVEEVSE